MFRVKSKLILLISLFHLSSLVGQDYFSRVLPFDISSPNPIGLVVYQDFVFIPSINFIAGQSASSITKVDLADFSQIEYHEVGFGFTRKGLQLVDNEFFGLGDNFINKAISVVNFGADFEVLDQYNYELQSDSYGMSAASKINKSLLTSTIYNLENNRRETLFQKWDTSGNEEWSVILGESEKRVFCWEIDTTLNQEILLSTHVLHEDGFEVFSQVLKFDQLGNSIWRYEATEPAIFGSVEHDLTELSNGNIVLSTIVDKAFDEEYVINDWFGTPTKYTWLDSDGVYIKDTLFNSPRLNKIYSNKQVRGKGDYFFSLGSWEGEEDDFSKALLTKFSNDGDILWTKRYLHPDLEEEEYSHRVVEIHEENNGDIIILGLATKGGLSSEMLLMRVNEQGCFGDENCPDDLLLTSSIETSIPSFNLKIFPNPSGNFIKLEADKTIEELEIFDSYSKRLLHIPLKSKINRINISSLHSGVYFIVGHFKDGNQFQTQFFKK